MKFKNSFVRVIVVLLIISPSFAGKEIPSLFELSASVVSQHLLKISSRDALYLELQAIPNQLHPKLLKLFPILTCLELYEEAEFSGNRDVLLSLREALEETQIQVIRNCKNATWNAFHKESLCMQGNIQEIINGLFVNIEFPYGLLFHPKMLTSSTLKRLKLSKIFKGDIKTLFLKPSEASQIKVVGGEIQDICLESCEASNIELPALTHLCIRQDDGSEYTYTRYMYGYISDREISIFMKNPILQQLRYLDLSFNAIYDKGVRTLVLSKSLPNLLHLTLYDNPITDIGGGYFIQTPFLLKLKYLDSRQPVKLRCLREDLPLMSEEIIKAIQQAHPKWEIRHNYDSKL